MKRSLMIIVPLCLPYIGLIGVAEAQAVTQPTCTEIGAFEINDGTCKNYYICVDDGEKLIPVNLTCASSAIFDPTRGKCVPANTTTCQQTTTPPPTTTVAPCVRYGRFAIPDVNCKKYYLCYWDGTRYAIMDNLSCPNKLVFEPKSEKCVPPERYACPGITGSIVL